MEWIVQIAGEKFDLQELSKSLTAPELCIAQEGKAFVLKSTDFNQLKDADTVQNKACGIINLINGAAKLAIGMQKPLAVDHVIKINDNGTRESFISVSNLGVGRVSVSMSVTAEDGTIKKIHQADPIPSWVEIGRNDANVAKVLRLWGVGPHDWVSLYRIYEVVESDVGGFSTIVNMGWVTKSGIKRFKHTANSPGAIGDKARHGARHGKDIPPKSPMTFSEAKSLIETILHNWIRSKE